MFKFPNNHDKKCPNCGKKLNPSEQIKLSGNQPCECSHCHKLIMPSYTVSDK